MVFPNSQRAAIATNPADLVRHFTPKISFYAVESAVYFVSKLFWAAWRQSL